MNSAARAMAAWFLLLIPATAFGQQAVSSDSQQVLTADTDSRAATLIAQSVAVMGRTVPADSVAAGTFELVEGSKTTSGTIRVLTRGLEQTSEQATTPDQSRSLVYSRGSARENVPSSGGPPTLEAAVTSQSPLFPLVILSRALSNPNFRFEFVGQETVEGVDTYHIRFWQVFPDLPKLQHLAEFSQRDVWIAASGGLPVKIAWVHRESRGPDEGVRMEVLFSDFRSIGGVLYPFLILQSLNGTPWMTIRIDSVSFNNGLSDADFPVN